MKISEQTQAVLCLVRVLTNVRLPTSVTNEKTCNDGTETSSRQAPSAEISLATRRRAHGTLGGRKNASCQPTACVAAPRVDYMGRHNSIKITAEWQLLKADKAMAGKEGYDKYGHQCNATVSQDPSAIAALAALPKFILVSSMPLADLVTTDPCRCHLVCSARDFTMPLHVLYDPDPTIELSQIPSSVVAQNLFEAVPALEVLMRPGSPIDRFYAIRGYSEPYNGKFKWDLKTTTALIEGKLLVRKVAAINYVVSRETRTGSNKYVIWADNDVRFMRPVDAAFFGFVSRFDVTYIPFKGRTSRRSNHPVRSSAVAAYEPASRLETSARRSHLVRIRVCHYSVRKLFVALPRPHVAH